MNDAAARPETEDDWQENFVEYKDPTELIMCFILGAAYIGLAKFCWVPLLLNRNWKMLINVEGFFITIAAIAILVGLRPYISPSNLRMSSRGIEYRGPYSPARKTVNWAQVLKVWVSPEVVFVLYQPDPLKKLKWVMIIACVYLSERERIGRLFIKHCPIPVLIMTTPTLFSRVGLGLMMFIVVISLEMMIG